MARIFNPKYDSLPKQVDENTDKIKALETVYDALVEEVGDLGDTKQDTLVSGENIKTINGESVLGSGNLQIQDLTTDVEVDGTSITSGNVANIQSMNGNYNPQSNKFATASDLTALGNTKQDTLTFDNVPTQNSDNPVKSGGVFSELAGKQANLVSGTNIKTINNESLLGSGNLSIEAYKTMGSTIDLTTDDCPETGYYINNTGGNFSVKLSETQTFSTFLRNATAFIYKNNSFRSISLQYTTGSTNKSMFAYHLVTLHSGGIQYDISSPQEKLVSGNNIKTINNESLLGSGNITIGGGSTKYVHNINTAFKITNGSEYISFAGTIRFVSSTSSYNGVYDFLNDLKALNTQPDDRFQVVGRLKAPNTGQVFVLACGINYTSNNYCHFTEISTTNSGSDPVTGGDSILLTSAEQITTTRFFDAVTEL